MCCGSHQADGVYSRAGSLEDSTTITIELDSEALLLVTRVKQQEFCADELDLAWRSRRKWSKAWHVSRQDHVRPEAFREDREGAYQAHKSRLANQGNEMGGWVNSLNSPFLWSTSNPLD
jgi:hypothetical protein